MTEPAREPRKDRPEYLTPHGLHGHARRAIDTFADLRGTGVPNVEAFADFAIDSVYVAAYTAGAMRSETPVIRRLRLFNSLGMAGVGVMIGVGWSRTFSWWLIFAAGLVMLAVATVGIWLSGPSTLQLRELQRRSAAEVDGGERPAP